MRGQKWINPPTISRSFIEQKSGTAEAKEKRIESMVVKKKVSTHEVIMDEELGSESQTLEVDGEPVFHQHQPRCRSKGVKVPHLTRLLVGMLVIFSVLLWNDALDDIVPLLDSSDSSDSSSSDSSSSDSRDVAEWFVTADSTDKGQETSFMHPFDEIDLGSGMNSP